MPIIARGLMMQNKSCNRHGMGIATVALIDSTVRVTMRQSDNVPIARLVAMAPSNREEAMGARLLSKPTAPDDPIIGLNPCSAGRITRDSRDITQPCNHHRQHCGGQGAENGETGAKVNVVPTIINLCRHARAKVSGRSSRRGRYAPAAMPARSSTSTSGRHSMVTKPGVCSTRRSQARIAGKVDRS